MGVFEFFNRWHRDNLEGERARSRDVDEGASVNMDSDNVIPAMTTEEAMAWLDEQIALVDLILDEED